MPQITLPIKGIDYPNKRGPTRRFAVDLLAPGDAVELRPEPKNPEDEHAIAVYSVEGVQMGYLPAERAPFVGMMMRRGDVAAIFQGRGPQAAFVRIGLDGEVPTLPPARQPAPPADDWWPDEEWPD